MTGFIIGFACWLFGFMALGIGFAAHYGLTELGAPLSIRIIVWALAIGTALLGSAAGSHIIWTENEYAIKKFLGFYK